MMFQVSVILYFYWRNFTGWPTTWNKKPREVFWWRDDQKRKKKSDSRVTCNWKDWSNEGYLSTPSATLKWNIHPFFLIFFLSFLDIDTSGDQNTRHVYKVAHWIQESCRTFVLIHPDITILSIPFEKRRTGILWNHSRSQETMYHMSLKFYCFTHLFVVFFKSACSSCSPSCCYSYRTVT